MAAGAQGYAYDALRRTAWVARTVWKDETYAALLEQAAADLRDRFQRDFWMPDRTFPALALDGEGRQVDALASDAGHLLWSGLLDKEYGELVGRRLLEPDFFSGWGCGHWRPDRRRITRSRITGGRCGRTTTR